MGVDAFIHLDTWHEWLHLFDLAHIVIVHRPGWHLESLNAEISGKLSIAINHRIVTDRELLYKRSSGLILPLKVTNINISSSDIRHRIIRGQPVEEMVPSGVLEIIRREKLYQNAIV